MKNLLVLALVILWPSIALCHPGKTDRKGGHKCWKDCAEWGLEYGEYHLHDKDFRPVRVDAEGNPAETAVRSQEDVSGAVPYKGVAGDVRKEPPGIQPREPFSTKSTGSASYEEGMCLLDGYRLALSAAVVLLLFCLIAIRARRAVKRR